MHLHESAEMYIETIYLLTRRNNAVRSIDVAEALGYSKPSVSRAVGLLKQGGYLAVDEDGYLTLTQLGCETAERIFERHTVLTRLLMRNSLNRSSPPNFFNAPPPLAARGNKAGLFRSFCHWAGKSSRAFR